MPSILVVCGIFEHVNNETMFFSQVARDQEFVILNNYNSIKTHMICFAVPKTSFTLCLSPILSVSQATW